MSISIYDSRYYEETKELIKYLSDDAYIKHRILVELHHFKKLSIILNLNLKMKDFREINQEDIVKIKEIEKETNHDVKAIEYFLRIYLKEHIEDYNHDYLIHFGLTSQDINSVAFGYNLREASIYITTLINKLLEKLDDLIDKSKNIKMLARTHGQPAIKMEMEQMITYYYNRIIKQQNKIESSISHLTAKFGGAIGDHSALKFILPNIDWNKYSDEVVSYFNLIRTHITTQIDSYDSYCNLFNDYKQLVIIIKDMNQNFWNYIKDGYFKQLIIKTEIGSSTMPQKVNPIDFENSLGQIELFISNIEGITRSLPYSSYQRDIKDSTILRTIGEIYAKLVLILKKTTKGISKLDINQVIINKDLEEHPEHLMEKIQIFLRFNKINNSYELVKDFCRGKENLSIIDIKDFIYSLNINSFQKQTLLSKLFK